MTSFRCLSADSTKDNIVQGALMLDFLDYKKGPDTMLSPLAISTDMHLYIYSTELPCSQRHAVQLCMMDAMLNLITRGHCERKWPQERKQERAR